MANRTKNGLILAFVVGIWGASIHVSSLESHLDRSYRKPDPASSHSIRVGIKGFGNIYVTRAEFAPVAAAWNMLYAIMGLGISVMIIDLGYKGYVGFIKEWRSNP
jgi:hypothetical protein